MFKSFENCIFCFEELPKEIEGVGEHVFPKNIMGFWRIYDVCSDCMRYFGDNIDQLSIMNPYILDAMINLKLPDAEKYLSNLPYIGEDKINGRKIKMVRKNNTFKIKTEIKDDKFIECPEDDWEKIGLRWLRKIAKDKIPEKAFEEEVKRIQGKYSSLEAGESTYSELLGYITRKRQVTNVQIDKEELKSITPLIAKIAVCFMMHVDPKGTVENNFHLVGHARCGKDLPQYTINFFPIEDFKKQYGFFHGIIFHTQDYMLDISFFRSVNWRVVLKGKTHFDIKGYNDKPAKDVYLIFDFSDLKNRGKHLGFHHIGEETPEFRFLDI